jgi:hypothetical protein
MCAPVATPTAATRRAPGPYRFSPRNERSARRTLQRPACRHPVDRSIGRQANLGQWIRTQIVSAPSLFSRWSRRDSSTTMASSGRCRCLALRPKHFSSPSHWTALAVASRARLPHSSPWRQRSSRCSSWPDIVRPMYLTRIGWRTLNVRTFRMTSSFTVRALRSGEICIAPAAYWPAFQCHSHSGWPPWQHLVSPPRSCSFSLLSTRRRSRRQRLRRAPGHRSDRRERRWPDTDEDDGDDRLHWKTRELINWATGRRFVWVDDEMTEQDRLFSRHMAHMPCFTASTTGSASPTRTSTRCAGG